MRDNFSAATKELLAKRVGLVCSNPECQQPTSGPQVNPQGVVNIGVAAHVTAASPGGARYDPELSPEQRIDSSNGIWLCQTCSKLIDSDCERFTREVLEGWKRAAERSAAQALTQGRQAGISNTQQMGFAKIERLMPALLEEMREDLKNHLATRQFIIMDRRWIYNGSGVLMYYYNDHDDLDGKIQVLANMGFVHDVTYNNVKRYHFSEELVDYLGG
jgi:hypothetical protein